MLPITKEDPMAGKKSAFLFGVHMHQPVDNFDEAVAGAVERCYAPFFSTMRRYPEFRFTVHCSGWLLEKIRRDYPDCFADMKALSESGSVEWVTAGYYEPILSSIPSRDRREQITQLSERIRQHFDQTPRGLWLTERVWEAGLIPDLAACGIRYSVVDDYHFLATGFDAGKLDGYYWTEEGGERLALFPISKALRYALPFEPVERAIGAIRAACHREEGAAILFDDAEKFGLWPETHEWVYGKGWLEEFVRKILEDGEIEPLQFGEYLDRERALGVAYLPNVSYFEMGEWSLKAEDALALERLRNEMGEEAFEREGVKFLKGGIWKNFFVKYTESNRLHKRMLEAARNRLSRSPRYREALHALQTNDVFWHGVFGGLYLPNLRDNAYRYLTECENLRYRESEALELEDADLDGWPEAKAVRAEAIWRFESRWGGQLTEWLDRRELWNFQNTLTRRREAYHEEILRAPEGSSGPTGDEEKPEEGIATIHRAHTVVSGEIRKALHYDWYPKHSLIDHISDGSLTLETLRECRFWEYGDFANQPFEVETRQGSVQFRREGGIYYDESWPTRMLKRFTPRKSALDFEIALESESPHIYRYGLEFNLHFADLKDIRLEGEAVGEGREWERLQSFEIVDPFTKRRLRFRFDHTFHLLAVPLRTVSRSEEGFELTTQGLTLMAVFLFHERLELTGRLEMADV